MPGLILVATPIGNLGDLSPRARQALEDADFWIVEDTRVSQKLALHLGIKRSMRVLNDHTPPSQIQRYLSEIQSGQIACLVTDGGSPAISDPGAILCDLCHLAGVSVDSVPGPCAVINALALSGFFAQRFAFLGFLPRKAGAMRAELASYADSPLTLVLFESPHRLEALLAAAFESLGARRYALCREMTKVHQQICRNALPHVPSETEVIRKGELTVVIEGKRRKQGELESRW